MKKTVEIFIAYIRFQYKNRLVLVRNKKKSYEKYSKFNIVELMILILQGERVWEKTLF